ncbi:MAG: TonB family protein [Bryobacterales bacterium]|nr:TonB family protein [Bryobacterales bacterium]
MTGHADILDQRESLRGPFTGALVLHLSVLGGLITYAWIAGHRESFGDPNAGGASVGIETVKSIPLAHSGPENPVAHDTKSEVPQPPPKPEQVKREPPPPKDAIALKSKTAKQLRAKVETQPQPRRFKSFDELDPNKIKSQQAPAVSNPLYAEKSGAGLIGMGANTTLGTRFGEYSQRIQQLVTQHWRTGDVDASIRTAPQVIVDFEIRRDGTIGALRVLQSSGISTLDFSARRAILESSPFPPLPQAFERNSATFEIVFELKR